VKRESTLLTLLALVTAGLTMRPLLTSVSTLLPRLQSSMGVGNATASLLAAAPMVMMGAIACLAGGLLQRHSTRRILIVGLALLLAGTAVRQWVGSGTTLLLTAALGGLGIGLVQMAMPGAIRQRFPSRSAAVTGLWSGALMGGGGLGAALTPWLAERLNTSFALSGWSVLVLLALLLWLAVRLMEPARTESQQPRMRTALHRFPRAWSLALSFGLVNGTYASLIAWLPDSFMRYGWPAQASGTLLALMIAAQVCGALILPLLGRGQDRRGLILLCLLLQGVGLSGFLFLPLAAPWLWAIAAGVGLGGAFPLALVLALDHLARPVHAARLVAFVQGVGFIIAGIMPFIAGQLRALTGSLHSAWALHLAIICGLMLLNLRFHPRSYHRAFPALADDTATTDNPCSGQTQESLCQQKTR
jgi:CP family cyanate transporter-like MFS transporter